MPPPSPNGLRRAFWRSFADGLQICWPVLSGLLFLQAALGAFVGLVEGWGVGAGIYFAFVTGLTIGYGDLVPTQALTQIVAVAIGFCGIATTALLAGLAVRAFQAAARP